jgi:beta-glucosidase-like glycosyl hydrolase
MCLCTCIICTRGQIAGSTDFLDDLYSLASSGAVPMERIDESVTRILELKEWLGLLDKPKQLLGEQGDLDALVGSDADKLVALNAARWACVWGALGGIAASSLSLLTSRGRPVVR